MLNYRSYKKELLDEENIPQQDLYRNLYELDVINKYLGGYDISMNALKKVLNENKSYTFVDIGSGGGDTVKYAYKWAKKQNLTIDFYGIDLKEDCISYSQNNNPISDIKFIQDDFRNVNKHIGKVDILHASLFCHHLSEEQIVGLMKFSISNDSILIINDLERNVIAYFAIKLLTKIFSKSYLVKNDAPLSVQRGFKKTEWQGMINLAEVKKYSLNYKWAFRHQIIIYPNE